MTDQPRPRHAWLRIAFWTASVAVIVGILVFYWTATREGADDDPVPRNGGFPGTATVIANRLRASLAAFSAAGGCSYPWRLYLSTKAA